MFSSGTFHLLLQFLLYSISTSTDEITSSTAKKFSLYNQDHFDRSQLCHALKCSTDELCVVNLKSARCVKIDKLHNVDDVHVGFATGEPNHRDTEEKNRFRAGRMKPLHKHKHEPRHYGNNEGRNYEHKLTCRTDVAWMFQQWDGNNDGELSVKELVPLETDSNEKCLRAYIDHCDTEPGSDNVITLDEWCDCFAWADDNRHEPPCHAAKHQQDPHLLGLYRPRCTLEGYYKAEQCYENHCWCVDKYGREFDNSRVMGRLPDCGQYATEMDENEKEELIAEL